MQYSVFSPIALTILASAIVKASPGGTLASTIITSTTRSTLMLPTGTATPWAGSLASSCTFTGTSYNHTSGVFSGKCSEEAGLSTIGLNDCITNLDGDLGLSPYGDYLQTCDACAENEATLTCLCQDDNQIPKVSSLDLNTVIYTDGVALQCSGNATGVYKRGNYKRSPVPKKIL